MPTPILGVSQPCKNRVEGSETIENLKEAEPLEEIILIRSDKGR